MHVENKWVGGIIIFNKFASILIKEREREREREREKSSVLRGSNKMCTTKL